MMTITVTGMGISGNASFCKTIKQLVAFQIPPEFEITIHVFETKENWFATGPAYSVDTPAIWTLNNPAKDFKFISDTQSLDAWISENLKNLREKFPSMNEEYCPRAVVGYYLKAQYAMHKKMAQSYGIKIVEHIEEVLEFDALQNHRWLIKTQKSILESDFLFLCFGHMPAHNFPHLESKPHYYNNAASLSMLAKIPQDAPVHIIGGQASFVDYAIWLAVIARHRGVLVSLTRNISIITTKGNTDTCDTTPLEELQETLTKQPAGSIPFPDAREIFWNTYRMAAREPVNPRVFPSSHKALSYQMAKYEKRSPPPELISYGNIDELRAFIKTFYFNGAYEAFWAALTSEGKTAFNQLMYSQIMAFLTGITPVNARLLLELYNGGRIVEKAGLTAISYDNENREFLIHYDTGETEKARYLIDTSGYGYNISHCNDLPFIQKAVSRGLLVPKPHGGIEMTDAGQPKNIKGEILRSLYCIGPIASNNKYPTPHASFLVFKAVDKAMTEFYHEFMASSGLNHLKVIVN